MTSAAPPVIACIDAFTDEPFAGNPAAVCLLDAPAGTEWMQRLAAEMSLPETAFVAPSPAGPAIRWFTPVAEVDLCGHATLAAAHLVWSQGTADPEQALTFQSRSGPLGAVRRGALIELDFPAERAEPIEGHEALAAAIRCDVTWAGRNRMDYLVEVRSERDVLALAPDMQALTQLDGRGVIVTSRADRAEFDFVSRFFAPRFGIPEDPATGSAHCALGPYWTERLGRSELRAFQASARGGKLQVATRGARVTLGGRACTIYQGTLSALASPHGEHLWFD